MASSIYDPDTCCEDFLANKSESKLTSELINY